MGFRLFYVFLREVFKTRHCARLKAPNEITAAQARDAFQRRASLFLLPETEGIKALLAKKINLHLQAYTYTSLRVLFTSHLSPHIHGGLCYCVWAIISDCDEWMNGHDITRVQAKHEKGDNIAAVQLLSKKLNWKRAILSVSGFVCYGSII